jgi:hypothetical protein
MLPDKYLNNNPAEDEPKLMLLDEDLEAPKDEIDALSSAAKKSRTSFVAVTGAAVGEVDAAGRVVVVVVVSEDIER